MDPPKTNTFGLREDVFRIFVSQILCYLLAIVYNLMIAKQGVTIKHIYNVLTGMLLCYYNFGVQLSHSFVTCLTTWTAMKLLGPSKSMVICNFLFTMGYLLYGYYEKERSHVANFTWTLPQCVLTLSVIALSFDFYDDANKEQLEQVNNDSLLTKSPSLLELLSKVYFAPTFLIGPQVCYKDFIRYTRSRQNLLSYCWKQSLFRLSLGLLYFAIYHTSCSYLPEKYFISDQFRSQGFLTKMTLLALYNKAFLCKYIAGWLISEGSCIMYGISWDPVSGQFNRCFNMNLIHYESTPSFGGIIESFNISTNQFASRYIFKRLKFFGNKLASHFITLLFLAMWHGFALGYYNTFAMEMLIIMMEKDVAQLVIKWRTRNQSVNRILNNTSIRWLFYVALRVHVFYMLSYAFTSFSFLYHWPSILYEIYYVGHFIYISWMLISLVMGISR